MAHWTINLVSPEGEVLETVEFAERPLRTLEGILDEYCDSLGIRYCDACDARVHTKISESWYIDNVECMICGGEVI